MLPSYLEDFDSKIPAIQVLCALGWKYLGRDEAVSLRDGRLDRVILTGILKPWLAENIRFESKGQVHAFTDVNILEAIRRLMEVPFDGLVRTNENIYNLLTLGTSLDQTIDGDRKGRSLHFIDWENPEKNVFHVTDEFEVERSRSHAKVRPDLVLFVNGVPFVVIECKRRDLDAKQSRKQVGISIEQMLRNQLNDYVPHLFQYCQLLMGTSVNDMRYGTVGTAKKYWSLWREENEDEQSITAIANTPPDEETKRKLFTPRKAHEAEDYRKARIYFDELWASGDRLPTKQDRTLCAMLKSERLLDLTYGYMVFDAGVRKIARYQQYFAVKQTIERVSPVREGKRAGGVVWHTTGSGKSLSMVMLAKGLALHPSITDPRVIIVTDRVDLDDQIWKTFGACGKSAQRAKTGEHLFRLIKEGKASVITTIINKFQTVRGKYGFKEESHDIFVLVDESHRSNYGQIAVQMRRVFPNACYLGFTGTPLLKKEKSTARKFGGIIHPYPMRQAVEDEAVTPLLYEGRMALLEQNKQALQQWFDRLTEKLSKEQKADLKKKMSDKSVIHKAQQRLKMIAFDVCRHYQENFEGTGFKAQFAADSRISAIRYRQYLRDFGLDDVEVIMSSPDTREGTESLDDQNLKKPKKVKTEEELKEEEEERKQIAQFWEQMMERFGNEDQYLKSIIASFAREDGTSIIVVVDKLLTGFDEPRNTVLYIDKPLKDHNILQAISRVNRLFTGKAFGYVIDYRGILGKLNEAMNVYDALAGFDPDDVDLTGAVIDTSEEVGKLPQRHSDLWAVFKEVQNKNDAEAMERHLEPEDRRQEFYDALRTFQKTLIVALASERFYEQATSSQIQTYKDDLKYFRSLRASVKQRYSEAVDYRTYENQIRKVMDSHIQSPEVEQITEQVNIFDVDAFDAEVEKREGTAAKADIIASRTTKTIHERMDENPFFYKKFAELVQEAIDDYRQQRISDAEYLRRVEEYLNTIRQGHESDLPKSLRKHKEAAAYFGVIGNVLSEVLETENFVSFAEDMALKIEEIIGNRKVRDWFKDNDDVVSDMENDLDDYLFDLEEAKGLKLSTEHMDALIEGCIDIAKKLDAYDA